GNLPAVGRPNVVRMPAYASSALGGFHLAPLPVAADGHAARSAFEAVVIYLLIDGAMNLGAFAVVIAVARRTRSGEIDSYSGLGQTSPGLAVAMTVFLLSLAGIPPTAGWFAKFVMFRAVFDANTPSAIVLGVIAAVASPVAERIHREGPIPFDAFVDAALYGDGGFFTRAKGAGRRGRDFVTSPEVGTLYGALVARALDGFWDELDRPDPYLVVDAGAGRGRLAADVLASAPRCSPALRYVLVERSEALRAEQREMLVLEP